MAQNSPFTFELTQLFTRIKTVEHVVGVTDSNFNVGNIIDRLFALEQSLQTISNNYASRTYVDNRLLEKINKTGDTLLGNLELLATPTNNNHLITKEYIDNIISLINQLQTDLTNYATKSYVDTSVGNKVSIYGDTLMGELILFNNATKPLHPVTKQQFDAALSNVVITGSLDW